jgi:hypothetical protein
MLRSYLLNFLVIVGLLATAFAGDEPTADQSKRKVDPLRDYYAKIAAKYEFFHDLAKQQPLKLIEKPVMTWTNDPDWSGDVFVWNRGERPEVIGCILTGPADNKSRIAFQEFHLLADYPIAATDMQGEFRWAPQDGLKIRPLEGAPEPAETPALRLAQMRRLMADFSAHMQAEGIWELRLLTQPLLRYQPKEGPVVDGALFTYVWTKGTDPELVLLLECRKAKEGQAWFYAPVRFTNREVWLKHRDTEVWRGPFHREQQGKESTLIYTTRYLATIPDPR